MTSLLAIANAEAGTASEEASGQAISTLRETYEVELVTTASLEELDAALAAHPAIDGVVVLGGDGSLHAVVAALFATSRLGDVTVGLVPLGTGNDFARTLGLPDDPVAAAQVIAGGRTRMIDLIVDGTGRVIVNAAHVGVGAEAAAAARPWKKALGPLGYAVGALISGMSTPGAEVEIQVDGARVPSQGPVIQVAVGNGRFVGGGAELLPHADPSDGVLDVAVSFAAPLPRRIAYAWHLRRAEHHKRDDVAYLRGSEVSVRGDALRCTSDGELSEPAAGHTWRVRPGALRMFVG